MLECLVVCDLSFYPTQLVKDKEINYNLMAVNEDPVTGKPIKKDKDEDKGKDKDKGGKGK